MASCYTALVLVLLVPLLLLELLAQPVQGSLLLRKPRDEEPAEYLYTAQDYQKINDLAPLTADNPYVWYYSPVAADEEHDDDDDDDDQFLVNGEWRYDELGAESRVQPQVALLVQRAPKKKRRRRITRYLSAYLEPPSPESVSDYARYRARGLENVREEEDREVGNYFPRNHRPDVPVVPVKDKRRKPTRDREPAYVRDHAPSGQPDPETEGISESQGVRKLAPKKGGPAGALELSDDGDRVEFQIQGHEGPRTYIFGFDTGDGKNRQFRLEERLKDGTVKGHYGYYDARGKLRAIKYLARPLEGYKERHHESNSIEYKDE